MNEDLANLVSLQKLDNQISALNKKKKLQEAKISQVEEQMTASKNEVAEIKTRIEELEKDKRADELELKTKEGNISRYKQQLSGVKNNKEYTALLHEIEILEKEKDAIEEKIIRFFTESEELEKTEKEKQAVLKTAQDKVKREQAELKKECEAVERNHKKLITARGKIEKKIPAYLLNQYNKLSRSLEGKAVVLGNNSTCNGCFMSITPQQFQLLKKENQILSCQSCHRILYWEKPNS